MVPRAGPDGVGREDTLQWKCSGSSDELHFDANAAANIAYWRREIGHEQGKRVHRDRLRNAGVPSAGEAQSINWMDAHLETNPVLSVMASDEMIVVVSSWYRAIAQVCLLSY